ncbi:MAG TPA: hypothetical protein VGQ39_18515, partial [Pyrinomonadaceae bacterium]|nr:hypothetical protein [Pyrinomonadaceae bacterium]
VQGFKDGLDSLYQSGDKSPHSKEAPEGQATMTLCYLRGFWMVHVVKLKFIGHNRTYRILLCTNLRLLAGNS